MVLLRQRAVTIQAIFKNIIPHIFGVQRLCNIIYYFNSYLGSQLADFQVIWRG